MAEAPYKPTLLTRPDMPGRLPPDIFMLPVAESPSFLVDPVVFTEQALARAKWWLPQQTDLLAVYESAESYGDFMRPPYRTGLPTEARVNISETERRFEHRCGELIRKGQAEGVFTAPNELGDGRISARDYLGTGRTKVTKFKEMGSYSIEVLNATLIECRNRGTISQDNFLLIARGDEPVKKRHRPSAEEIEAQKRSEHNVGRRHVDPNKVVMSFADQLEATISTMDLVVPEDLDPGVKEEAIVSIRGTLQMIFKEIGKW